MRPYTFFVDIDGCIIRHCNRGPATQWDEDAEVLPGVVEWLNEKEATGACIVLITARPESLRSELECLLRRYSVFWHKLIMGITSGHRNIINDIKPGGYASCSATNVPRNTGLHYYVPGTTGIVLAAGQASRMPNKLLLSINGGAAVESAVQLCQRSGCERIQVVVGPNSLVQAHLVRLKYKVEYSVQSTPKGVIDAIQACQRTARNIVAFGDNVYPVDESIPAWLNSPAASVRLLRSAPHLDGWEDLWVLRDMCPAFKLAGWYVIDDAPITLEAHASSIDFLNSINAMPIVCQPNGWFDIGTEISYEEYLKHEAIH